MVIQQNLLPGWTVYLPYIYSPTLLHTDSPQPWINTELESHAHAGTDAKWFLNFRIQNRERVFKIQPQYNLFFAPLKPYDCSYLFVLCWNTMEYIPIVNRMGVETRAEDGRQRKQNTFTFSNLNAYIYNIATTIDRSLEYVSVRGWNGRRL